MLLGVGPDGPVQGRRVAVTGMGVVSCCGIGLDAFWDGLQRPAPEGERRVAGFDPPPGSARKKCGAWTASPSSRWPPPTWR